MICLKQYYLRLIAMVVAMIISAAAPGLVIAGVGAGASFAGSGLEIIVNLIVGNHGEAIEDAAWEAGVFIIEKGVDAIIPGNNPDLSPEARDLLIEGAKIKLNAIESIIND